MVPPGAVLVTTGVREPVVRQLTSWAAVDVDSREKSVYCSHEYFPLLGRCFRVFERPGGVFRLAFFCYGCTGISYMPVIALSQSGQTTCQPLGFGLLASS